jgi:hypothetical protein
MFETLDDFIEKACEVMHDAYEKAAVGAGWETQQSSRKPWSDVPEANKATMRAAVSALLTWLQPSPGDVPLRIRIEELANNPHTVLSQGREVPAIWPHELRSLLDTYGVDHPMYPLRTHLEALYERAPYLDAEDWVREVRAVLDTYGTDHPMHEAIKPGLHKATFVLPDNRDKGER